MRRFLMHLFIHLWILFYFGIKSHKIEDTFKMHDYKLNHQTAPILWNTSYQFGVENTEFKIPDLRYVSLFSQSVVFKTEGL